MRVFCHHGQLGQQLGILSLSIIVNRSGDKIDALGGRIGSQGRLGAANAAVRRRVAAKYSYLILKIKNTRHQLEHDAC